MNEGGGLDLGLPRKLGELLRACLHLYRSYFWTFATIALVVVVPAELLVMGLGAGQLFSSYDATPSLGAQAMDFLSHILVITPLITAMHVQAVVDVGAGRVPSVARALRAGLDVFLPLVAALLIMTLGVFAGFLALLVPGLYLLVRWYVVAQAVMVDGRRATAALARSGELVQGMWWRVFGIVIVFLAIAEVPTLLIGLPLDHLAKASGREAWRLLGTMVTDVPVLSFLALSGTLLYFDLCARHEETARAMPPASDSSQP